MTWHKRLRITGMLYLAGGLCLLSGVSPQTMWDFALAVR